ncbi:hypothetical protein CHI12_11640 [Terribacillus saccharophilus]|uniref:Gram-positive cocci surface proteins LPxTG domain-containing protein n=1 Tax=Terribacillus saccharophilus TaxID=361277 RepID=A0A268HBW6_9BACI|nr:hypothetical protein [Terribacillus saccharophilus]PAE07330.1 hypothetical protein CHI12_11640 [Terribacillus saccharophilus]
MLKKYLSFLLVIMLIGIIGGTNIEVTAASSAGDTEQVLDEQGDLQIELSSNKIKPNQEIEISLTGKELPEELLSNRINIEYENTAWLEKNEGTHAYSGNARVDVYLKYNEESKKFEGTMFIPEKALSGEWKLTRAHLVYSDSDLSLKHSFNVESEFTDITPPEIKDFSFYNGTYQNQAYQSEPVYVQAGDTLTTVIDAYDENFGTDPYAVSVSLNNTDEDGDTHMVADSISLKNIPGTTKFSGSITIPDTVKSGDIGLRLWSVEDNTGNGVYDPSLIQEYKKIHVGKSPAEQNEGEVDYQPELNIEGKIGKVNTDAAFDSYIENATNISLQFSDAYELDAIELPLSKKQIQTLKNKNNASITFGNEKVSLSTPVSNLEEKDTVIKIARQGTLQKSLTDVFDFEIVQNGKLLSNFQEKVTLHFSGVTDAEKPFVYYLDDKGNLSEIESKYENDSVYGYTNHFSKYVVFEKLSDGSESGAENGDTDKVDSGNAPVNAGSTNNGNKTDTADNVNSENEKSKADNVNSDSEMSNAVEVKDSPDNVLNNMEHNKPEGTSSKEENEGKRLADTFSGHYNLILLGCFAILAGALVLIYRKKLLSRG